MGYNVAEKRRGEEEEWKSSRDSIKGQVLACLPPTVIKSYLPPQGSDKTFQAAQEDQGSMKR